MTFRKVDAIKGITQKFPSNLIESKDKSESVLKMRHQKISLQATIIAYVTKHPNPNKNTENSRQHKVTIKIRYHGKSTSSTSHLSSNLKVIV